MSRTTETLHVYGVRIQRVRVAVESHLSARGFEPIPEIERARAERLEPQIIRIGLRREGKWTTIADARGASGFGRYAVDGDLEGWGRLLSRELDRSVLAIWTWDGEASLIATRYKRGKRRGRLELLDQAWRGEDGRPRAPAKVFWPWLPKNERETIVRDGIPLAKHRTNTGDAELDDLLDGFDDVDDLATDDDDLVYVPLETAVAAIGAAVGMKNPALNPWELEDGDEELVFRRRR